MRGPCQDDATAAPAATAPAAAAPAAAAVELRGELHGMKLGDVRRRAEGEGIENELIEAARDDDDDPKAALIELIMVTKDNRALENTELKQEVTKLKEEVTELKEEIHKLKTDYQKLEGENEQLEKLRDVNRELKSKIDHIVKVLKAAEPTDQDSSGQGAAAAAPNPRREGIKPPARERNPSTAQTRQRQRQLCETCGSKEKNYGLANEGKKRWCSGCGKAHNAVRVHTGQGGAAAGAANPRREGIKPPAREREPVGRFQEEKFVGSYDAKSAATVRAAAAGESFWVQCEGCEKWRRAPKSEQAMVEQGAFRCEHNTWDNKNRCTVAEEDYTANGQEYVEAVLGKRTVAGGSTGQVEYYLKWFGTAEKTWEPVENCDSCRDLIAGYERRAAEKLSGFGQLREAARSKHARGIGKPPAAQQQQQQQPGGGAIKGKGVTQGGEHERAASNNIPTPAKKRKVTKDVDTKWARSEVNRLTTKVFNMDDNVIGLKDLYRKVRGKNPQGRKTNDLKWLEDNIIAECDTLDSVQKH
eukprot:SAG22_NODE_960_length_6295_cov_76.270497_4_plen_529_part_00